MYLNLPSRDIAAGARKFSWDSMLQDAILRHRSEYLAKSFSQSLCKFNLALNELQVALELGKQVSRRGFSVATTTCYGHLSLLSCKVHYSPQCLLRRLRTSKASAARRVRFCSKQRNQPSQNLDPSVL
jgi:hypothetical protein